MQHADVFFAPDIDTNWSKNPGCLAAMAGFAPLQQGSYGSLGGGNYFGGSTSLTGTDHLTAYMFRKVSGAVRFLTFRKQNIDEYDSAGNRTNQGTGYNASTAQWSAAAWGDQIIACNYLDATQSSTGAGFSALGGGSPKARHVAANLNFVLLADVDDGGSNVYSDMVWWCALQNPASWTPSLATQAGNIRLLDAPGPIRAIVAYRDTFVAFKDNAVFVGEYVGPANFIFQWRLVSSRVGCIAPKAVAELDGKLYFLHSSGVYEFDGQSLTNIGLPVFQSFLTESSYISSAGGGINAGPPSGYTSDNVSLTQAVADDIEGVVWFRGAQLEIASGKYTFIFCYGYNPRSGKWGRSKPPINSGTNAPILVRAYASDIQAFKASTSARFLVIDNSSVSVWLIYFGYPIATTSFERSSVITGIMGSWDGSQSATKVGWRVLASSDLDTGVAVIGQGFSNESGTLLLGSSVNGTLNTEFDQSDIRLNARFSSYQVRWTVGSKTILAGIGIEGPGQSRR